MLFARNLKEYQNIFFFFFTYVGMKKKKHT